MTDNKVQSAGNDVSYEKQMAQADLRAWLRRYSSVPSLRAITLLVEAAAEQLDAEIRKQQEG